MTDVRSNLDHTRWQTRFVGMLPEIERRVPQALSRARSRVPRRINPRRDRDVLVRL